MTPKEIRNEKLGTKLVKNLQRRNFNAFYCSNSQQAIEKVMQLMPESSSVTWGGTMTLRDMGLIQALYDSNIYELLDRDKAPDRDAVNEIYRRTFSADFFLSSANAISEDGVIVNIDGNGNRVAAITFGPKSVIIACGMNKVVRSVQDAETRARTIAAPINAQRFDLTTPCVTTGRCSDCKNTQSICSVISRIRLSKPTGRIKVVLIGENLGF